MKFGIFAFPGSHGYKELIWVLKKQFKKETRMVWHQQDKLSDLDAIFIPGGYPCKGSSEAKCLTESPAINAVIEFAEKGKIVIGIGNGFRLLCDAGLVPGDLRMNRNKRFICRHVFIKPDNDHLPITSQMSNEKWYRIPIATGYGRYTARDETLIEMRHRGQIIFRYCDHLGRISEEINVTGSIDNIAGICNSRKNVFGIVPQPERASLDISGNTEGQGIFRSLIHFLS
ncbi:MAG: phosphoribosylformylglycinamidine synthase I [Bacteroidales bacterium]|nr:phosphoribosylformylglycinamidine synthase I [Bacteroidales bacterium]MBN2698704.1 phosphoribosylformylglycinamidine synthase I [Bacteroidales bacterium]